MNKISSKPVKSNPKGEYVEMCRGIGIDYEEKIVRKCDVRDEIVAGWMEHFSIIQIESFYGSW